MLVLGQILPTKSLGLFCLHQHSFIVNSRHHCTIKPLLQYNQKLCKHILKFSLRYMSLWWSCFPSLGWSRRQSTWWRKLSEKAAAEKVMVGRRELMLNGEAGSLMVGTITHGGPRGGTKDEEKPKPGHTSPPQNRPCFIHFTTSKSAKFHVLVVLYSATRQAFHKTRCFTAYYASGYERLSISVSFFPGKWLAHQRTLWHYLFSRRSRLFWSWIFHRSKLTDVTEGWQKWRMTARFLSSPHWRAMVKDLVWTFSRKSLRRPDNLYFTLLHKSSLRVIFPHQRGYLGIRNWSFWEGGTCAKNYIIVQRIFKSLHNVQ